MTIDWEAAGAELTSHLRALIRFETANPPGHETQAAAYIANVLRAEGIESEILEGVPGRGNLVARLAGNGGARPLLLMGHTDVVSVEPEQWSHGPFSGDLAGGYIWGRGAVDMKGQVAANLMVVLLLKRHAIPLTRDLILAAFADEEAGSTWGARWMWEHHRDLIEAEYALNEGGGGAIDVQGARFYLCQVGEKGSARLRITARAAPGHASVPRDDTAIARLARALVKLDEFEPPTILTKPVRQMLQTIGDSLGGQTAALVNDVLAEPSWAKLEQLPLEEAARLQLRATTRNTAVPTILRGGHRINVIPSEVAVDVDGRILPGQEPEAWREQVQRAVGSEVEVTLLDRGSGLAADPESPLFDTITQVMAERDPGARTVPFLVSGGTDAKALPGVKVYGFMPSRNAAEEGALAHAHDERVSAENLLYGCRCLYEIVERFCRA